MSSAAKQITPTPTTVGMKPRVGAKCRTYAGRRCPRLSSMSYRDEPDDRRGIVTDAAGSASAGRAWCRERRDRGRPLPASRADRGPVLPPAGTAGRLAYA